jgi:iron complex transport system substrate-binding protein
MSARYPERIVCLTEETTETLYLLGEERRIVGISGYTRGARSRACPRFSPRGSTASSN